MPVGEPPPTWQNNTNCNAATFPILRWSYSTAVRSTKVLVLACLIFYIYSSFSSIRCMPTMKPQQDFSKSFCSCFCPLPSLILSCSFLVSLGLPSHYPSSASCSSTCPYSKTAGNLLSTILVTCLSHASLLFLILSTNVISFLFHSVSCFFWISPIFSATNSSPSPLSSFRLFFSALRPLHYHWDDKCSVYLHLGWCCYIVRPPYFVHCTEHCRGQFCILCPSYSSHPPTFIITSNPH